MWGGPLVRSRRPRRLLFAVELRLTIVAMNDIVRTCVAKILPILMFAAPALFLGGQSRGADDPKFEVASVKRTDQCSLNKSIDPGRVVLDGFPLNIVIAEAFSVKMDQVIGGPSWLDKDCFTINAKIPAGVTKDQIPVMLRTLLAERLKLAARKESRPSPGYILVIDKNGAKLKQSDPNSSDATAGRVRFAAGGAAGVKGSMTMTVLARYLSNRLGSPVQDLTGLNGRYDVDLAWAPDEALERIGPPAEDGSPTPPGPIDAAGSLQTSAGLSSVFTALRESLGLRLERRKQEVDVVVIDHIEQFPVEN
jgi:uncharacterized protein (TIGR03435 family)